MNGFVSSCVYRLSAILTAVALALPVGGFSAVAAAETSGFSKSGHTTDSLETVKKRVEADEAVLLDVREQSEWDAGHLKAAHLLPLSVIKKGQFTEEQKKLLPKDKPIYCHCRSGARTLMAARILRPQGYDVRPLRAGYSGLVRAGFEKAETGPADQAP